MGNLNGKVALVTGSSRGLGKGIALVLAEQGADLVINYKNSKEDAFEVMDEIEQAGGKAISLKADVSKAGEVKTLFDKIIDQYGKLDVLINNAGVTQSKDIFEISEEDWDFLLNTNLKSCYHCSKRAMEIMKDQKSGRIVNISSVVGKQGALFGHIHYAATKSGQLGFTRTLARTGAPYGITVNAIAPGIIETDLLHEAHDEERLEKLKNKVPLGLGTVRDCGLAVAFLCGEGGRYITGATIDVNGGLYMG